MLFEDSRGEGDEKEKLTLWLDCYKEYESILYLE